MNERPGEAPSLGVALAVLRQGWIVVAASVTLGLLAGGAFTMLCRQMPASQALVVLPAAVKGRPSPATFVTRQRVLAAVFQRVGPATSPEELRGNVKVTVLTPSVVSVVAAAATAEQARARANVVARTLVAYLGEPANGGLSPRRCWRRLRT